MAKVGSDLIDKSGVLGESRPIQEEHARTMHTPRMWSTKKRVLILVYFNLAYCEEWSRAAKCDQGFIDNEDLRTEKSPLKVLFHGFPYISQFSS